MKQAIGTFNGWRCPSCKRLVAKPINGDQGKCKACGEPLLFGLTLFRNAPEPSKKDEGVEIPVKILKSVDEQGRPVMVNFLNRPLLLKSFEKYGKDKDLFLTEVILGFAAMGYKSFLEKGKNAEATKQGA